MITTANLKELRSLLSAEAADPHHILGMHEVERDGRVCMTVRAFIPQAAEMFVTDTQQPGLRYPMCLVHEDGFFEAILHERGERFAYNFEITARSGETWFAHDPYSFTVQLSELDLYLFSQGTHYEVYRKLGAHHMQVDGVDGVYFAVWAPNARRVSVIGDFNTWDGRRHQMRLIKTHGVWELFVPGVCPRDKYKFEIRTTSGALLEKSDPYGVFADLRPSTVSMVYDIENYVWNDADWIQHRRTHDPRSGPINIYEVHLGSWDRAEEGTTNDGGTGGRFLSYVELADKLLPYVKDMHYTHIELLPVCEHPLDASWGYQVIGFYAPTSRYGTPEEFMYFVDKCHQHGIGVIMDWVPGHFPKDAHGLGRFDGSALYEHEDPRQGEHREWGTYIFNYGRPEVRNFLIANALYWIEMYHIDGIRVDAVASMLYLDFCKNDGEWVANEYGGHENIYAIEFIKHLNSIMQKRNPHVMMIAEESTSWGGVTRDVDLGGLGFSLKWNMGWMNDMLYYTAKEHIHRQYHHNNLTFASMYNHTENFVLVLSHDEVVHGKRSLLNRMPGDLWRKFAGLRTFLGFMYGHSGKKLLFMGGEFGQFIEWDEKRPLDWFLLEHEHHAKMLRFTRDLNALYLRERSLWHDDFGTSGFEWIQADDRMRSLITFFRKSNDPRDITIFICNFTPTPYPDYRMGVPYNCAYREIFSGDDAKYGGSGVTNPHIMQAERLGWDKREFSISIMVPPLSVSILKPNLD
ncbi:MAG: 1,4-alpha-glucan branching protein GlgB [Defluviitaleaceae bacterium]|nr:1,4-alpha-glucan branching protein GlgB [Defluviitaleaceae bacterium]